MSNKLREQLQSGQSVLSTVVTMDSPTVAEILATAGFDCIWIDMEHSALSLQDTQALLQAISGRGVSSIVRVAWNDPVLIKRALDLGSDGIMIPLVNTKEEAEQAVRACLYPPAGIRGAGCRQVVRQRPCTQKYVRTGSSLSCEERIPRLP